MPKIPSYKAIIQSIVTINLIIISLFFFIGAIFIWLLKREEETKQTQTENYFCPPIPKQNPSVTKQNPSVTKQNPLITKQNPPVTKQNPPITKQNPPITKQNPPVTKQNPLITKQNPPVTKQNPLITKQNPPVTKQNCLVVLEGVCYFNGETDYFEIDEEPSLNFGTEDFSISAWVQTGNQSGIQVIVDKRIEVSGPIQGYVLAIYKGSLLLQLADGLGKKWTDYMSSLFIADRQWHHLAVTVDRDRSDGIKWYLDGIQQGKSFNPLGKTGSLNNSKSLTIARRSDRPNSPGHFQGYLADIQLCQGILPIQKIEELSQNRFVEE